MWTIQQISDTEWQVLRGSQVITTCERYDQAVGYIALRLGAQLAEGDAVVPPDASGDGLLPETWEDDGGIFFSEPTGDGRDFSACVWTWRDPATVPVPLMLQTCTDIGHFGAELAGFVAELSVADGTGHSNGRFYDTDRGREARQLLMGSRSFGVSVDPGAVDATFRCVAEDDEGWCMEEAIDFLAYEVIGVTMTPFAGFQNAKIRLRGAAPAAVTAGATEYGDLPLSERTAGWDAAAAEASVRKHCSSDGSGEPPTIDWDAYASAFFWFDAEAPEEFGSYKLCFAEDVGGALQANWSGVGAAAGLLQSGSSGVPEGDLEAVQAHVASYYEKAAAEYDDDTITAPWAEESAAGDAEGALAVMEEMVTDHDFQDDDNDGFCDFCINTDVNGDCQRVCGAVESMHGAQQNADGEGDQGDGAPADGEQQSAAQESGMVSSALRIPSSPPRSFFEIPEPEMGASGMRDVYGMDASELLIEQPDGQPAVPLQILEDGRVYGHIARWGQPHVGFPGRRVTAPESQAAYAHFHVGEVVCDDGSHMATGTLVVGSEHAPLRGLSPSEARDFYAHSSMGWANVRVSNGRYGVWASGVLRPDVNEGLLRVLRSLAPSGDWRRIGASLEMIGALMVNVPGFPVAREAITAAALELVASAPLPAGTLEGGETSALVAAGMVYRCPDCAKKARALAARQQPDVPEVVAKALREMKASLDVVEKRTRHLREPARADLRRRIFNEA